MLSIDICVDKHAFLISKPEWDSLLNRSVHHNLFLSWEWISSWMNHMMTDAECLYVIMVREDDHLVGIAPLVIKNSEYPKRTLEFIGQVYSYHLGFLAEKGKQRPVYEILWQQIFEKATQDNLVIQFVQLEKDHLFEKIMAEQSLLYDCAVQTDIFNPCKVVELPASFFKYFNKGITSQNIKKNFLRDKNKLVKDYEVEFFEADPESFEFYWSELLRLHREMMKLRNKGSALSSEEFPAHLKHVSLAFQKKQGLKLYVFKINGEIGSVCLCIVYQHVVNALTLGVNYPLTQQLKWLNITTYSIISCIKSSINGHFKIFDLLGGRHQYKYQLGGHDSAGVKITIHPEIKRKPIAILTHAFLNPQHLSNLHVGGVETWLLELIRLLVKLGFAPVIYQKANQNFQYRFEGVEVIGFSENHPGNMTKQSHQDLEKRKIKNIIYASSFIGINEFRPGQIFIQHGIHWDYTHQYHSLYQKVKWEWIRRKLKRNDLKKTLASKLTIAVDSNYLNYCRVTLGQKFRSENISFIPNFAIPQNPLLWKEKWKNPGEIHVVFARRFELRRGVIIFAEAVERILQTNDSIRFTFAGGGSLEPFVKEKFANHPQVSIVELDHGQVYDLLKSAHIAVIPSTYSEGTSLSCLEAMACGCAVISTDIGGLSDIVTPDYNGLLIKPTVNDIGTAINYLTNNLNLAKDMADRGYDMICHSFSLAKWQHRVTEALKGTGLLDDLKLLK